jgi:hypothetical protein
MADNLDPEYLRDLEAALQASREAIDDWTTELLSGKTETEAERDTRKQNIAVLAAEKKAREDLNQMLRKAKDDFKNAGLSFGSALVNAEGGMSKYNSTIKSVSGATAELAKHIPYVGLALSVLAKVIGMAAEAFMEANDRLLKGFNELGEIGASASLTTTELLTLAQTAGYGTRNLEGLIKPIKSLGSGLIALGGSTGEGAKKFAELAHTTQEQRDAYRRLGLTQEEVTQLYADSVKTTALSGVSLSKSVEKQRKANDDYIETMLALSAITGATVKQQQEARQQAINQGNFAQYLYSKGRERDELRAKAEDKNIDEKRKAELKAQADKIDGEIKSKTTLGQFYFSVYSASKAAMLLASTANHGTTIYTSANSGLMSLGYNFDRINKITMAGGDATEAAMEENAKAMERFDYIMQKQGYSMLESSEEMRKAYNVDNESIRLSTLYRNRNTETGKTAYEAELKKIRDIKDGKGPEDALMKANNARLEAEKLARDAMDKFYKLVQGPVNNALTSFFESLLAISDWIADKTGLEFGSKEDRERRKVKKETKELEQYFENKDKQNTGRFRGNVRSPAQQKEDTIKRYRLEELQGKRDNNQSQAETSRFVGSSPISSTEAAPASASGGAASTGGASTGGASEASSASPSSPGSFNYDSYAQALGKRESNGIYSRNDNPFGYRGKYQFGAMALEDVNLVKPGTGKQGNRKLTDPSVWNLAGGLNEFLQSPGTQEAAMKKFTDLNKTRLESRSLGVLTNNSSPGDIAGYLAVTHLLGQGAARNLKNGRDSKDGFGTTGSEYLALGRKSQIPQAALGGYVNPTSGGTAVMVAEAGSPEALVPLKNPDSILYKLLTGSSSEVSAITANNGSSGVSNEMIQTMIDKFDKMISYLSDGVDIQQKILRQSS